MFYVVLHRHTKRTDKQEYHKGDKKMITAYKKMFQNYLNFNGRTTVKDYWLAFLANLIIAMVLGVACSVLTFLLAAIFGEDSFIIGLAQVPTLLYSLAIIIPFISMAVRRMHDQNRPGWIVAACYIGAICCGIGSLVLVVFMCLPGTVGPNQYGPDENNRNGANSYNGYAGGYNPNQQYMQGQGMNQQMNQQPLGQQQQFGNVNQNNQNNNQF